MPEVDEDGKMINPHIPQYISTTPWYYNTNHPTLKHQTSTMFSDRKKQLAGIDAKKKLIKIKPKQTKWRKDSCENCGSLTHKKRDCLVRQRRITARELNVTIGDDIQIIQPDLLFTAKRDQWQDDDGSTYSKVIERYEKLQKMKHDKHKKAIEKELQNDDTNNNNIQNTYQDSDTDNENNNNDDDNDLHDTGTLISNIDESNKQTVRNLRIREDTAKYLRNLDIDSSYYDPKTRVMRENPYKDTSIPRIDNYKGDVELRSKGDVEELQRVEQFTKNITLYGDEINLFSSPTLTEEKYREFLKKKQITTALRQNELDKNYGIIENVSTLPASVIFNQTDDDKILLKDSLQYNIPSSKYVENQLELNHTKIWGSYYDIEKRSWGYGCCYSLMRNSYCISG